MSTWKDWVLDITNLPTVAFCPVEDRVAVFGMRVAVFGMTVIADRCPGSLVGVVSQHGLQHVDQFIANNPGWRWSYGSTVDLTGDQP